MNTAICYLRKGRKLRASGDIVESSNGLTKVKPTRPDWGHIWLTGDEIDAGKEKPAYQPRPKQEQTEKPKRVRKPKAPPVPRWKQLVDQARIMEIDHHPEGWPAVKMGFISAMADELEAAQSLFQSNGEAVSPLGGRSE